MASSLSKLLSVLVMESRLSAILSWKLVTAITPLMGPVSFSTYVHIILFLILEIDL
jgi:hypothetical protein